MKYFGIFGLFTSVLLFFWQPGVAATVYNRISSSHYVHSSHHLHQNAEVKACKPPREEDVLNRNSALKMFITGARRNIKSGKSSNIIYHKPLTHFISYRYTPLKSNRQPRVVSTLIFFPFHGFW